MTNLSNCTLIYVNYSLLLGADFIEYFIVKYLCIQVHFKDVNIFCTHCISLYLISCHHAGLCATAVLIRPVQLIQMVIKSPLANYSETN